MQITAAEQGIVSDVDLVATMKVAASGRPPVQYQQHGWGAPYQQMQMQQQMGAAPQQQQQPVHHNAEERARQQMMQQVQL